MNIEIKQALKLIRSHYGGNEREFKETCLEIEEKCNPEIGEFILALVGETNTFTPGGGEVELERTCKRGCDVCHPECPHKFEV